jgi:hypothetical protein
MIHIDILEPDTISVPPPDTDGSPRMIQFTVS